MFGVNHVMVLGCVGKDLELRTTATGKSVVNVSLALQESRKDVSGEWKNFTSWVNVTLWGDLATKAVGQIRKGNYVYVEGKLVEKTWTNREGVKVYKLEIMGNRYLQVCKPPKTEEVKRAGFDPESPPEGFDVSSSFDTGPSSEDVPF